jgi:hypothetical protein
MLNKIFLNKIRNLFGLQFEAPKQKKKLEKALGKQKNTLGQPTARPPGPTARWKDRSVNNSINCFNIHAKFILKYLTPTGNSLSWCPNVNDLLW